MQTLHVSERTHQKFQSHRRTSAGMQYTNIQSGRERNYTREAIFKACSDRDKYFFLFKVLLKSSFKILYISLNYLFLIITLV